MSFLGLGSVAQRRFTTSAFVARLQKTQAGYFAQGDFRDSSRPCQLLSAIVCTDSARNALL